MSDPSPTAAPVAMSPIQVNAKPSTDQLAAGLRTFFVALGSIALAFGAAKYSGYLTLLAGLASPIATVLLTLGGVAAVIIGQFKTRRLAQERITLARMLPDEVAHVK